VRRIVLCWSGLLVGLLAGCTPPAAAPAAPAAPPAAGGSAAAPGPAAPPSPAPTPVAAVTIKLHTPSESTSTLPITVAQHLGCYAEEGIDLVPQPMPPNVGMAALLAGEVQFSSAATSALSAAATGAPVRLVISLAERPAHVLVGARGLAWPDTLRGATIASSSPGGVQHRETLAALRHFGLAQADAVIVALQNDPVRQAALESGAAQAAVLTMPFNFKLEREGYPRLLNFAAGDLVRLPVGALAGTLDYLPRNEDVVVRALRATLRGLRATRDNRPATVAALQEFFAIDAATASDLYAAVADSYTLDGRIAPSAIRDALESGDAAAREADPAALVDFRYLDRATQTLGAR
jgi:ABC-type nitrate/sulfonate/bicarbonate transport system substrate-binding protein